MVRVLFFNQRFLCILHNVKPENNVTRVSTFCSRNNIILLMSVTQTSEHCIRDCLLQCVCVSVYWQHVSWSDICQSAHQDQSVICHVFTDSYQSELVETMIGAGKQRARGRELWLAVWAGSDVSGGEVLFSLQPGMLCSCSQADIQ